MKLLYSIIFLAALTATLTPNKGRAQCLEKDIINLKKIAIVFGETNYKYYGSLKNPINDATDITDSLRKLGFTVYPYFDVNREEMIEDVKNWYDKLKSYDVALFYFSGHGAEVYGQNYLLPVDAAPRSTAQLPYASFSAEEMLEQVVEFRNLKYSIVILDACRSNPFTKSISEKGLASMSAKGAFIAFAASPGSNALEGNDRNSIYTQGILKYITVPNLTIDEIFTRVNSWVKEASSGDQAPFKNSSLGSDYCFSVNRSFRLSTRLKESTFQQPNSNLLLSKNEQYLFGIASNNEGLIVRDSKTLNILCTIKTGLENSNLIACKNDDLVYLADSVSHAINIVDWQKKKIIQSIKCDYAPLSLMFSVDTKKMYICGNNKKNGFVSIIDLHKNSLIKSIQLKTEVAKMVISSDGRHLYVTSQPNLKTLTIIDLKLEKISKEINPLDLGDAIGITPDDRKLYFGSANNQTINVVDDLKGFQSIKVIPIPASSFAFTEDSKYLFAINDDKITMIQCVSDEPMYQYLFVKPKGVAITADGYGLVWLPNEHNIYTFPLLDTTKKLSSGSDLDMKWKAFAEKINHDPAIENTRNKLAKQKDSCDKMYLYVGMIAHKTIIPVINKLFSVLNNYAILGSGDPIANCSAKIVDLQYGFHSTINEKNTICPNFRFKFSDELITITILDNNIDKIPEIFKMHLSDITATDTNQKNPPDVAKLTLDPYVENALTKFVKDYFIKRSEYLDK